MSLVLISHHNETIYDINKLTDFLSSPQAKGSKGNTNNIAGDGYYGYHEHRFVAPMTNFKKTVQQEVEKQKCKRKPFGVMGRPKQSLPDPKSFLRKHTGKVFAVEQQKGLEAEKGTVSKKDPVPKTLCAIYEQMHKLRHNKRNFVRQNVKKVLEMKPKVPIRKEITDVRGKSFRMVPKEPEQVSNKIFAKIPRYLDNLIKHRQATIEAENERKGIVKQKCTYITRDERKMLLEGLKKNWDELQRVYQGLPILTDTIPKKTRKRELENQLQQLERDIVLIERHPFIYVYDEEEDMHN